ncbi:MAG: hypothetical protein RIR51_1963 [Bacteroidota bacterium]|jgi:2-dehydro-3-deoxyphosphogluconate aldolase/(4S)-4-hydroxy-2-oxoglutarate aldolase
MARNSADIVYKRLEAIPIVPLFYNDSEEICTNVLQACYDGGVRVFEFTNRGDNAPKIFEKALNYVEKNCPDLVLGIGTILDVQQAEQFIQMGTDFILQPFLTPEVGEICGKNSIPWMPGTMTLTEIRQAELMGSKLVKIFPGNVVGPGFVKAIKGPMPKTRVMVTGGVEPTKESLTTWFNAGANAVGMGSQLFPKELIASNNYDKIREIIQNSVNIVSEL